MVKSPQVLNSISSIAKSLPQPPAPLFIIFKIMVSCPAKVLKSKPYSFQFGLAVSIMSPVSPSANLVVSELSQISKRTLTGMVPPGCPEQKLFAITRLITHAENS